MKSNQSQLQNTWTKSLTFSTVYKHNVLKISENKKIAEYTGSIPGGLCEQVIPKSKSKFAIKILENDNRCYIGIANREILEKINNCYGDEPQNDRGLYLIKSDGTFVTHYTKSDLSGQVPFKFSQNDIIITEVNLEEKYISWSKFNSNNQFMIKIDDPSELVFYPCVFLAKSKLEIIDSILI